MGPMAESQAELAVVRRVLMVRRARVIQMFRVSPLVRTILLARMSLSVRRAQTTQMAQKVRTTQLGLSSRGRPLAAPTVFFRWSPDLQESLSPAEG